MLIERINESIARKRELSKSNQLRRKSESYAANAQAAAMPLEKSAKADKTTVLTAFRVILS